MWIWGRQRVTTLVPDLGGSWVPVPDDRRILNLCSRFSLNLEPPQTNRHAIHRSLPNLKSLHTNLGDPLLLAGSQTSADASHRISNRLAIWIPSISLSPSSIATAMDLCLGTLPTWRRDMVGLSFASPSDFSFSDVVGLGQRWRSSLYFMIAILVFG
ncbi:hypothetical protein TIFTF001_020217 [Ficus carica]|uniref:Uncharacterized protein n=1 Tax=Ficus carica TaxID=3494 RepID=A0AA88ARC8_FICCA|nr:hypothetical protein TIFTF001_020217 [Ficus carica]